MDFDESIDKIRAGFIGEALVREFLKKQKGCKFTQIDLLAKKDDKWYTIEVKHQDMFESPPFDGHGLPTYQVQMRLELYHDRGIIPLLFILDKKTKKLYYNNLITLDAKEKYVTKNKGRIIYPLCNFVELQY